MVENAIHYTPPGGHVLVRAHATAIEVLDDGPGLAAGRGGRRVRAASTAAARAAPEPAGTGLGLPIARELMRTWGGDATLANRPEGGALATLTAPAFAGSLPPAAYRGRDA